MRGVPVDVSALALTKSFVELRSGANQVGGRPAHLLRFYSVECGLKAALLRRRNLRSTAQLDKDDGLRSHDLRRLAAELRIDKATYRQLDRCRRRGGQDADGPPIEVRDLHEAWRYGAGLNTEDEQASVAGLQSLEEWCREVLRR
jgi:hypothetical protein